jgi:hypothetical protein
VIGLKKRFPPEEIVGKSLFGGGNKIAKVIKARDVMML